jgi:putative SOS response-associated peptidase YedK
MPDADYNIAPTTQQPIIRESRDSKDREIVLARWGLIPFFTKTLNEVKGLSTINARAETIATARTWREPFRKRRCLVPASAFYEWPKYGQNRKQPYVFELSSGGPFAFCRTMGRLERRRRLLAAVIRHRHH